MTKANMKKLSNGTINQLVKIILMHRIILETVFFMGKEFRRIKQNLLFGTGSLLSLVISMRRAI